MSARTLQNRIPRFAVPTLLVLLVSTLLYSLLVLQAVDLWLVVWGGAAGTVGTVLLLYLFYRLVVAVEKIADSL
jgi:hypothetical protein